jgi:tRNA threonylcarbamoyladenosine biosynthesis protein TsaB
MSDQEILLGIDTCGATGSIALGRVVDAHVVVLGQTELAGGEFASRIVGVIADLLDGVGIQVAELAGIIVVIGPGTFTGIRIGLSTAKALAEACGIPVVTVSRLALLAHEAGTPCAALDAHRGQVFLGIYAAGSPMGEMLVTAGEFSALGRLPGPVAFCEEGTAHLMDTVATDVEMVRTATPPAFAAIRFALERWRAGDFADVATIDGYYLRGADAKTQVALAAGKG